jgi:hypothetical protein
LTYLNTTTAGETSNSWLGDTLDVVSQDLAMTFCTTLAEALATFAASSHVDRGCCSEKLKKLEVVWYEDGGDER